jgi:hypothetical protein
LSIAGRRGSSGGGWTWSRPPARSRRPLPRPPLLPLIGAAIIALFIALTLLGLSLSDSDGGSQDGASVTATATPGVTATPSPTATPGLTATPSPTATPTSAAGGEEPLLRLAAWDGERWQSNPPLAGATYREGESVPFLFSIERARPDATYSVSIRFDCAAFDRLTSYERAYGSQPALAAGGPKNATADTIISLPHEPNASADDIGSLSLWGGSFTGVDSGLPSPNCSGEKSMAVGLAATADTLYLISAAEISAGAAERGEPLRLMVQAAGTEELSIEIPPESVRPAQP